MALYAANGEKRERPSLRSLRYQAPDLDNKNAEENDTKSSYTSLSLEKKELIRKESLRKENGPRDIDGEKFSSLSSTTPPLPAPKPLLGSTGRYVPLSERKGLTGLSGDTPSINSSSNSISNSKGLSGLPSDSFNRLSSRRAEMRETYFKSDVTGPKLDGLKTEKDNRDKEKYSSSLSMSSGGSLASSIGQHPSGAKENIIEGYVGFANLPNQVYRKAVKRGFEFTLMVVGESGLGKSTLINSMFLSDLYSVEYPGPSHRIKKTVQVESTQCILKENGVQLRLKVVDTPGFGDAVDNSNCWEPVIQFIEARYEEYLNAESRVSRKTIPDSRVHCCLYFISPNGHGLKPLDVEFMKRLHDKVNIIPLIAKADTLTPDECREFKKTILNEIAQHKIKIYEFPDCDDEEENKAQKKLKDRVPFAVVGSNTVVDSQGRKVRGRIYPWGVVEVENLEHNDFIALRNMLIRTHMQDLKDVTNNVHYENFRYNNLAQVSASGKSVKPAFVGKQDSGLQNYGPRSRNSTALSLKMPENYLPPNSEGATTPDETPSPGGGTTPDGRPVPAKRVKKLLRTKSVRDNSGSDVDTVQISDANNNIEDPCKLGVAEKLAQYSVIYDAMKLPENEDYTCPNARLIDTYRPLQVKNIRDENDLDNEEMRERIIQHLFIALKRLVMQHDCHEKGCVTV